MILMLIAYVLRRAFKIKYYLGENEDVDEYLLSNSTALTYDYFLYNFPYKGTFINCFERFHIATIGKNFPEDLKEYFEDLRYTEIRYYRFKDFETVKDLEDYVSSPKYGNKENPEICFGIYFDHNEKNKKYDVSLHYFASKSFNYPNDIPNSLEPNLDIFLKGPDFPASRRYIYSGYLNVMKRLYDYILIKETGNDIYVINSVEMNMIMINQKYNLSVEDQFEGFMGYILGFFLIITYAIPLTRYIFIMVKEKETKAKEGMKIMGLSETYYFLSYFIQFFILNLLYTIVNSLILNLVFKYIPFIYILLFFFLFGMNIFGLVYFFQSFLDKTRLAMIVSILIYFLMYFLSTSFTGDGIKHWVRVVFSIFPPIALQIGLNVMTRFETSQKKFEKGDVSLLYRDYCIRDMLIMLTVDIFIFLFLGFYLQNIITHDFGISRSWNFLCTKSYWGCGEKKKKTKEKLNIDNNNIINNENNPINNNNIIINKNNDNHNIITNQKNKNNCVNPITENNIEKEKNTSETVKLYSKNNFSSTNHQNIPLEFPEENFQSEEIYSDYTKPGDTLKLKKIKKVFSDGKIAVNGVSFNLYKNEIFALLGHNGAGKSTLISILTGLYTATEGEAEYNEENIINEINMDEFRKILGICPQHDVLFPQLTIEEHLRLFCVFKGLTNNDEIDKEIEKSIHDFSLETKRDTKVENLSGGQKRKLSIAIALIGGSKVIFLDEPTSGMDITSRRNLWDILKRYCDNRIIVLTTHYMEEAAVLGKRIGIISAGNMVCIGSTLFLIEKFGKFISINIIKDKNCVNDDVIKFIKTIGKDEDDEIEIEALSEEILFRIPKVNKNGVLFDFEKFFMELDNNVKLLNIKTYTASMPTLEDVFLNVSSLERLRKKSKSNLAEKLQLNTDQILYDEENYNQQYSFCQKFYIDLSVSVKKRFKQIYRDSKTFILEILCPVLLIIIGLGVSSVEYFPSSPVVKLSPSEITKDNQVIFYYDKCIKSKNDFPMKVVEGYDSSFTNYKLEKIDVIENENFPHVSIIDFWEKIYKKNYTNNYGSYLCITYDEKDLIFEVVTVVNSRARQGTIIYPSFLFSNIIKQITKKDLEINFSNKPLPMTKEEKDDHQARNNVTLVFFISIAFTLIPANFITIIIKERETNTKHLQIISGISLLSYWFNNYLFELIKYYVIGGFSLLMIWAFGFYKNYLYLLYILYGPSMVSFTYLFSFIFHAESSGQNAVILVNFIAGALAGSVILVLRIFENLMKYGKVLQFIFRIIPSFCFCYGYNELLSMWSLYYVDYPDDFTEHKESEMITLKYVGSDCLFLAVEIVVYLLLLILAENVKFVFKCCFTSELLKPKIKQLQDNNDENNNNNNNNNINENNNSIIRIENVSNEMDLSNVKDSIVIKEINKANKDNIEDSKYAIVVQNLIKNFKKRPFCNTEKTITKAVRNLSFCLEYGECFGFLGVNGAGKTTTFKCLSNEYTPSYGRILIDNKEINTKFNEIRCLIGYCPQFDSIFEYMTVYENLEFYSKIKGMKLNEMDKIINSLLIEMNLYQYKDKVSGELSGGNKRKLSVSIAMLCNPPIILLDEPSTGMDPEARRFMWSVIHKISIRKKKSSVIMTTHSMEEAETLCQRIAIMVNGQFKCLGSSNYIKEKYGEGYEINLQISALSYEKMNLMISNFENKYNDVKKDNIQEVLEYYNKKGFINELEKGRFGYKLVNELNVWGSITLHKLFTWIYYIENVLKLIKIIKEYFNNIICCDFIDNSFVFRIKREHSENEKSIGFLFGLVEKKKNEFNVEEYSIQLTSLEQIFNGFAKEMENNENVYDLENINIDINEELFNNLGI